MTIVEIPISYIWEIMTSTLAVMFYFIIGLIVGLTHKKIIKGLLFIKYIFPIGKLKRKIALGKYYEWCEESMENTPLKKAEYKKYFKRLEDKGIRKKED